MNLRNDLERDLINAFIFNPSGRRGILEALKGRISKKYDGLLEVFDELQEETEDTILDHLKVHGYFKFIDSAPSYTDRELEYKIKLFLDTHISLMINEMLEESKDNAKGLDLLEYIRNEIRTIEDGLTFLKTEKTSDDVYKEVLDDLSKGLKGEKRDVIYSDTFPTLNNATQGLMPGNIIVIAGSYKQGKSFFGKELVWDFAKQKIPTGVLTLEMSDKEYLERIMAGELKVLPKKFRTPKNLTPREISSIDDFPKNLPLYFYDSVCTEFDISSKARAWKNKFNLRVLMIDYIGLVETTIHKNSDRERQLSYVSRVLKNLAKELSIVIIVLAQLNRLGKHDPSSDKMAESIGIVRDADYVFIIHKPYDKGSKSALIDGRAVEFTENHFILKLDDSRHTKSDVVIPLIMDEYTKMSELAIGY